MPIEDHYVGEQDVSLLDHYRLGRLYRIPICCIIRWIFTASKDQGDERGGCLNPINGGYYVPCDIFHKDTEGFKKPRS